ncbi:MAG: hypothetical protein ACRYFX_22135 [Janthinobacterium lividum]
MSPERFAERFGPALFTLVTTVAMAFYVQRLAAKDFEAMREKLGNSVLSISTSMLGFFLTIYTIIHSVNTERMRDIRANSSLVKFLQTFLYSHAIVIGVLLLFSLRSLAAAQWVIKSYTVPLWLVFIVALAWSVSVSLRFIRIFLKIIGEQ